MFAPLGENAWGVGRRVRKPAPSPDSPSHRFCLFVYSASSLHISKKPLSNKPVFCSSSRLALGVSGFDQGLDEKNC